MLKKDNVSRSHTDDFLTENKVAMRPEIEIGGLEFLAEFARIGLGIALVIRNFIEKELKQGLLTEIEVTPVMPM